MARQKRKLKFLPSNFVKENKIHFDSKDELFANEHYGYYLMCTIPKSSVIKNPRRYIYFKYKEEYYLKKNSISKSKYKINPIHGKSCILDTRMKHKSLILQIISLIFEEPKSIKLTESILIAIGIVIDILEFNNIILKNIKDLKSEHQLIIYEHMNKNRNYILQDKKDVTRFFGKINLVLNNFEFILPNKLGFNIKNNSLNELSSSIMYQLELQQIMIY